MHYPGPSPTSVSCTRLFACGERTKVSNSSYSWDPHICASFRPLASSCTWKEKSIDISGVKSLKVMHYPGLLSTFVSSTRLFACVDRTKVSNTSYSWDPRICASFRPLVPSYTSKGRSNNIWGVIALKVMNYPGPLPTSVSSTRLFACGERTKVSNSSYSWDPHIRASFRPLAPSCT
jgi:uncharacterized protein involved in tolerance to divalent cations